MRAPANGIELEYETFGDPEDPPLLLVMGLGAQMIWIHPDFCEDLVDRGFFVIRFDNRDIGLSTRIIDHHIDVLGLHHGPAPGRATSRRPTRCTTWPPTPGACATTSASTGSTCSACRSAG